MILDQKRVYPAFKNADFIITSTGVETMLEIPLIQAQVTYTGSSFGIDLPFNLFKNNTEGQCGEYSLFIVLYEMGWPGVVSAEFKKSTTIVFSTLYESCSCLHLHHFLGTCDNLKVNDCRSPTGQVEACVVTAQTWLVAGETCPTTTTPAPTLPPKTTTTAPVCKPSICEIITSQ